MSRRPRGYQEAPGLYLHLPFCSAICPYCDFAVTVGSARRRRDFLDALLAEIALYAGSPWASAGFDTIYLGGGTPSLHEPAELETLLATIRRQLAPDPAARLFLEANPEDVDRRRLDAWRRLGVDFLSLGVQSFDDPTLAHLGRRHDAAGARRAAEAALAAGFDTVSIDLIFALPDQPLAVWRRDLEQAVALAPHHLSLYELEIHERTTFGKRRARGELVELDADRRAERFFLAHERLDEAGYAGYEVSNFARAPAHRSGHNRKYWRHVPYLGLGPSAHSFDGARRFWNERSVTRYGSKVREGEMPIAGSETLSDRELALETLMLGLRTEEGVDLARFAERFGYDLRERNRERIDRLVTERLLEPDDARLLPTVRGLAVADGLAAGFELGGDTLRPPWRSGGARP